MLAQLLSLAERRTYSVPFRAIRLFSSSVQPRNEFKPRDKFNYNPLTFDEKPDSEHANYALVTANELQEQTQPPKRVKMLVRDYIEDSLYNPHYGYFSKQAKIFSSINTAFDYSKINNSVMFQSELAKRYAEHGVDNDEGPGRQTWHTPTELFKPWYGQAIAQCMVSEYLLKYFPYDDFIIYEMGAGNGTLALNILDYIQDEYPEVYERTRYNIIEISSQLSKIQCDRLSSVHPCAAVRNKSIFHWRKPEPAPCFFVAMEVIDNFAHDMIRYDLKTMQPYQALVVVDEEGDYETLYMPVTDPLISSFLSLRRRLGHPPELGRWMQYSWIRHVYRHMPFSANLSLPEFIPTRLLTLLNQLRTQFPLHRLLLSDFSTLPDTIPGHNAPVVQTRHQNTTVACETLLVQPGYFDIFFPTHFERLQDMYEFVLSEPHGAMYSDTLTGPRPSPLGNTASLLAADAGFFSSNTSNRRSSSSGAPSATGLPVGQRKSSVFSHADFMSAYADLSRTTLRNGENPMLDYYKNVKFLF